MKTDILCRLVKDGAEIRNCFEIRRKIFVEEQGLFDGSDVDEHDTNAHHIAAFINDRIIGTVRVYREKENIWWGGRLAVLLRYRGRAGRLLIQKAVETVSSLGAKNFFANVQIKNVKFFKSLGWKPVGEEFEINTVLHQLMEADLDLRKGEQRKC